MCTVHNLRRHPLYNVWAAIKQRCNNPQDKISIIMVDVALNFATHGIIHLWTSTIGLLGMGTKRD